jgi:hypothetical protein
MRKHLAALAIAIPLLAACADAPTSSTLDPQVGFAVSNPPPPPVSGFSFGFSFSSGGSTLDPLGAMVARDESNGPTSLDCSVPQSGVCYPTVFYQNEAGDYAYLDFQPTVSIIKLPRVWFNCGYRQGRIVYNDGWTKGTGCAWAMMGTTLVLIDLTQFNQPGNLFNLVRDQTGALECTAVNGSPGLVQAWKVGEGSPLEPLKPFVPITLSLFQFKLPQPEEYDDVPCGANTSS